MFDVTICFHYNIAPTKCLLYKFYITEPHTGGSHLSLTVNCSLQSL